MGTAICNRIVAFARVVGAISRNATDFLVLRDLVEKVGRMGASPMWLPVTSTARISNVSSSIPRWSLRQTRRFGPPCLRACHSPSPSTLIPVLSISRCNGPWEWTEHGGRRR